MRIDHKASRAVHFPITSIEARRISRKLREAAATYKGGGELRLRRREDGTLVITVRPKRKGPQS